MWSGDDRQVSAKRGFDFLVEVVGVVVGEEDEGDWGEGFEGEGGVGDAGAGYAGAEVDVVAGVEEVGLGGRGGLVGGKAERSGIKAEADEINIHPS